MSDLDLDALEASYTNTSRIAEKDVYALITKAREAEAAVQKTNALDEQYKYFAQHIADRDASIATLTADLATARAQLAMAREALEPFAKRSNYLGTTADDVTHWHPAVGSPVSAGDLHRARDLGVVNGDRRRDAESVPSGDSLWFVVVEDRQPFPIGVRSRTHTALLVSGSQLGCHVGVAE